MSGYPNPNSRSAALFERANHVLPGGNSRLTVQQAPYPLYAVKAAGCRVADADGVERVDFVNNQTTLIHGHCHPEIVAAAQRQAATLACAALPTEPEIGLAETICGRVESVERIRFTNSGTEAVMQAIRAARAFTERPVIAKCEHCYHGSYDAAEISLSAAPESWGDPDPVARPHARGTPQGVLDDVVVLQFNDVEGVERQLAPVADRLAAIIVDPMPSVLSMMSATTNFLAALRAMADRAGALLISDEVISFRLARGGAQDYYGYRADLTTFGKTIGGGFPIGGVGGRADVMAMFDARAGQPPVPHGGTFNANPVSMAAGQAAMDLLTRERLEALNALGAAAQARLRDVIAQSGRPAQVVGGGSLWTVCLHDRPLRLGRDAYRSPAEKRRHDEMLRFFLNRGVITTGMGLGALSTVTGGAEVELYADALAAFLRETNWVED